MIDIMDFQQRCSKGEVMKTMQFDLKYSKVLRRLVADYEIDYDPSTHIASDELADKVFQAGIDLLVEVGLHNMDTERVVSFTRPEIEAFAKEYYDDPVTAKFGRGEDAIEVRYRTAESKNAPMLAGGPCGVIQQEWFHPYVQSFAQEEKIKAMGISGGIASVDGHEAKAGTLSEMYCAQWECNALNEVVNSVGRPGLHMGLLCTASSASAIEACMRPGLREKWNTQIGIHVIPEQKISWDRFTLAKFCQDWGITPWTSCVSLTGALARNGAETAVGLTANLLAQLSYGHGTLAMLFANHLDGTWADNETQWAFSAACRGTERNLRIPIAGVCAGMEQVWRTEAGMWQSACMAISNTASNFSYAWIGGHSGLESIMVGQIMEAVNDMELGDVEELLNKAFAVKCEKFDEQSKIGPRDFPDAYDLKTVKPTDALRKDFDKVKNDLANIGLKFKE